MFTHTEIENACNRLEIDSKKRGKNPFATAKSIYAKDKPANLKKLGFPEEERNQVEKIGQIINNLCSQVNPTSFYNLTNEKGKLEKEMDDKISKFLPILNRSVMEWFSLGCKKTSLNASDFCIDGGLVHQIDKEKVKSIENMNEEYPIHRRHPGAL